MAVNRQDPAEKLMRRGERGVRKLLLLCWLAITPPLGAEVNERLAYADYTVPADPLSLADALNTASPHRQDGQIHHAYTTWYVRWRFRWREGADGRCRITGVTTELSGTISLPRLVGADAAQQARFERYLEALREHELGHYANGREAALAIDAGIQALPAMPNCKTLASTANALGYRTVNEHKARDAQYDASTGHGRTQGAWLQE